MPLPAWSRHLRGNIDSAGESTQSRKIKHMGDKSPKSNQKKSSQKQSKVNSADQKKQQAMAAAKASLKKK
jgi:hypothetical protein